MPSPDAPITGPAAAARFLVPRQLGGRFRPAPGVSWAVESLGVVLVPGDGAPPCCLAYPWAAVWDLLGRGRSFEAMVRILGVVGDLAPEQAEPALRRALSSWAAVGLVERRAGDS